VSIDQRWKLIHRVNNSGRKMKAVMMSKAGLRKTSAAKL